MEALKSQVLTFFQGPVPDSFMTGFRQSGKDSRTGAMGIFLGKVRADVVESETVTSILYTAYEQMAVEKMEEISRALFEKYPIAELRVGHSLGDVPAGAVCLCVYTASRHRKAAMEACTEAVERLKQELPIWGRENFEGSAYQWKINRKP